MHATPSAATVETGDALDALCHGALDALGVLARHARWTDAAPPGASARAGVLVSSLMQAVFVGLCRAMDLSPPDLPSDAEALTDEGFTLVGRRARRGARSGAGGSRLRARRRRPRPVYESLLGWTLADAAEGPSLAAGHARGGRGRTAPRAP